MPSDIRTASSRYTWNMQQTIDAPKTTRDQRAERLEARMTRSQKEVIQRAAHLQGRTMSEFVIVTALQAANEIIQGDTRIKLSDKASRAFAEALLNPAKPTEPLKRAFADHTRLVDSRD